MVSCAISWNGISRPTIVDAQKVKISADYFTQHLKNDLIPAIKRFYPANDAIIAINGATSHTVNVTQQLMKN